MFADWLTFFGFFIAGYEFFYAGLDEIGIRVFICGSGIGILALNIAVWTFVKGRTSLCMNIDWDNNYFSLNCEGKEIKIETPDKISSFKVTCSAGNLDPSVTAVTAAAGTPMVMREEDWHVSALYELENNHCGHIWSCVSKREGKRIVKKLNNLLRSRQSAS